MSVISISRCSRRGREIFPRTSVPRHRFSGAWSGLRAFEGPQTRVNIHRQHDEGALPSSVPVGLENAARLTSFRARPRTRASRPDGAHVAFSGNYKGQTDVHVVPIDGDTPTRLTWHPGSDEVQGWAPDGSHVLFTSGRDSAPAAYDRFWTVSPDGGKLTALPIPRAHVGRYGPDGNRMVYSPSSAGSRTCAATAAGRPIPSGSSASTTTAQRRSPTRAPSTRDPSGSATPSTWQQSIFSCFHEDPHPSSTAASSPCRAAASKPPRRVGRGERGRGPRREGHSARVGRVYSAGTSPDSAQMAAYRRRPALVSRESFFLRLSL